MKTANILTKKTFKLSEVRPIAESLLGKYTCWRLDRRGFSVVGVRSKLGEFTPGFHITFLIRGRAQRGKAAKTAAESGEGRRKCDVWMTMGETYDLAQSPLRHFTQTANPLKQITNDLRGKTEFIVKSTHTGRWSGKVILKPFDPATLEARLQEYIRPLWVSVADQMPPIGQRVVAWSPGHSYFSATYDYDLRFKKVKLKFRWFIHGAGGTAAETITHWIPELPGPKS